MLKDYQEDYPNITLNILYKSKDSLAKQVREENIDLVFDSIYELGLLKDDNLLLDLNPYINNSNEMFSLDYSLFLNQINNQVKRLSNENETYAIPGYFHKTIMWYNTSYFNDNKYSVPTTLDELWTLCETIKNKDPESIPLQIHNPEDLLDSYLVQKGVDLSSVTNEQLSQSVHLQNFVSTLKSMQEKGYVEYKSKNLNDLGDLVINNKTFMVINNGTIGNSTKFGGSFTNASYTLAPLDKETNTKVSSTVHGLAVINNSKEDNVKSAAYLLAKSVALSEGLDCYRKASTYYMPFKNSYSKYSNIIREPEDVRTIWALTNETHLDYLYDYKLNKTALENYLYLKETIKL